jgi:alpha-1,2-mannosyltransferase
MNSWLSVAFDVVTRTLLFLFIRKVLVQCNRTVLGFYSEYKWETSKVLAFFHPYCDSGGGGERVLWMTINAILEGCDSQADVHIVIYSGSTRSKIDVLRHVRDRFSINLLSPYTSNKITLIPIYSHVLMEAHRYPYATMIFQCLASILVGLECVLKLCPNIYIDTTGAAFTYPLFRILDPSCKVLAYVHYPIISSDMLRKVREKRPDYNNRESISKSETISRLKLLYYSLIARMYGLVGSWANEVMVNSTWTKNHIDGLWGVKARLLYPPCNTEMAQNILLDGEARLKQGGGRYIVSVGQFRPEKDHFLQLRALKALLDGEEGGR